MLNSGSEHLLYLKEEFKDKIACNPMYDIYPVDEQQVSDMVENIKQGNYDTTPNQLKKDENQPPRRGIETSGMTNDKENIPVNKPFKKILKWRKQKKKKTKRKWRKKKW